MDSLKQRTRTIRKRLGFERNPGYGVVSGLVDMLKSRALHVFSTEFYNSLWGHKTIISFVHMNTRS